MDLNTLHEKISRIETELPKLTNTLYAMKNMNTNTYPQNYEELSTDAALRAEHIACSLRNIIFAANLLPRPELMEKTAAVHGITIFQDDHILTITLPGLLPKRKKHVNTAFLTEPLHFKMEQYLMSHSLERYEECVICFTHVYDAKLSTRRIRDYDNMECKQILDTVAAFLIVDDTGLCCDAYHTTILGESDCTILTVMAKSMFSQWLISANQSMESMSDF